MYCLMCDSKLRKEAKFCHKCGTYIIYENKNNNSSSTELIFQSSCDWIYLKPKKAISEIEKNETICIRIID